MLTANKLIKKPVEEIKKIKEVNAIILFGSHATGKAKPYSDIDLCVLTKKGVSKAVKEKILSNSSQKLDISLFSSLPPQIRFRIMKEGKLLFIKNKLELQRAEVATVKNYIDFKHTLDFFQKKYIGA